VLGLTLEEQGRESVGEEPTLGAAVRGIARLGGFLGRRGDGEPGVKSLWRGWARFQERVTFWELLERRRRGEVVGVRGQRRAGRRGLPRVLQLLI
jgi:Transposase Tn5 dimerisation domain